MSTTTQQATEQERHPVDFSRIDPNYLDYEETYRCSQGAIGQIIRAMDEETEKEKALENDFQKILYPGIDEVYTDIVDEYMQIFSEPFDPTSSDIKRQVFGANLNGSQNNGKLRGSISKQRIRFTTYQHVTAGDLIELLKSRCEFIYTRDPMGVTRYQVNEAERTEFCQLQELCKQFYDYLSTVSEPRWKEVVEEARKTLPEKPTRSTNSTQSAQSEEFEVTVESTNPRHTSRGRGHGRRGRGSHSTYQPRQTIVQTPFTVDDTYVDQFGNLYVSPRNPHVTRRVQPSGNGRGSGRGNRRGNGR